MTSIQIDDTILKNLKDAIVLITGGSSGIGLGTVQTLLTHGAHVSIADLNPPPADISSHPNITFTHVDVLNWAQLSAFFAAAVDKHGRIDHVFANAGIGPKKTFLDDELDAQGALQAPDMHVIEVDLHSVVYTVKLAVHWMRRGLGAGRGGSIVLTASVASWTRFLPVDYTVAKHGVLGVMRGVLPHLEAGGEVRIRINSISPNWTETGMVPREPVERAGFGVNTPEDVGRIVGFLMADGERTGECVFTEDGRHWETEGVVAAALGSVTRKAIQVHEAGDAQSFRLFENRMNQAVIELGRMKRGI